jgi:hypothetical protein
LHPVADQRDNLVRPEFSCAHLVATRCLANEVRRFIRAAGPGVFRNLRIRTEGPRSHDAARQIAVDLVFRCDDLVWSNALLHPALQSREHAEVRVGRAFWFKEMEGIMSEYEAPFGSKEQKERWAKLPFDQRQIDMGFRLFYGQREERIAEQIEKSDVDRWVADHPEYIVAESNRKLMDAWLKQNRLAPVYGNLDRAYAALKDQLALDKSKIDPPASLWHGELVPQETATRFPVGQSDPSKAASGEKQVTKRVSQQGSDEYIRNLRESPSFRKRMDES